LDGILVASITPRIPGSAHIHLEAWQQLLAFFEQHSTVGTILFGTTGEFPHFSPDAKLEALRALAKHTRRPLLLNVSDSCFDSSVSMALRAADAGAAAVVLLPPSYFRYSQHDLIHYFLAFAELVAERIPVYLYNIPALAGPLEAETALQLAASGRFAGIKDSSGDPEIVAKLLHGGVGRLYLGADGLIARFRPLGASGAASGIASALPELMVALDQAAIQGDLPRTQQLHALLEEFLSRFLALPIPILIKEACSWRGLPAGPHSVPLSPERQERLRLHREWFQSWLPQVLALCPNSKTL
jgi:dihydrodipicolinate synthase/N-acetylneuraminate lyase